MIYIDCNGTNKSFLPDNFDPRDWHVGDMATIAFPIDPECCTKWRERIPDLVVDDDRGYVYVPVTCVERNIAMIANEPRMLAKALRSEHAILTRLRYNITLRPARAMYSNMLNEIWRW